MRIVLLVADQMMRDGLRALFSREPGAEIVGESDDGPEALELVRDLQPNLAIADIGSWASGSMEMVRRLSQEHPEVRIVALSSLSNRAFVAETFRNGVHGFVLKQDGFAGLLQAVRTVMSGSTFLCSRATEGILETCMEPAANPDRALEPSLTERECVVLQMLSEGRTSKEIALSLDVSSKTIDACRRQLMRKLDVDSVAGLVKRAIMLGMTTLTI